MQGVLLMSLGSPNHLDEMEEYLVNVRRGRAPSKEFVEEIKERYRQAGGKSPLLEITERQAQALETRLNRGGGNFKVYVGMRHWHPYIQDTMKRIAQDGVTKLLSLPLTPYYSRMSTEAYHDAVRDAKAKAGAKIELVCVESWNVDPLLIDTYIELLDKGLAKFPDKTGLKVLFTAHSLPARILMERDPYQDELLETVNLVASKMEVKGWDFAYQSQGGMNEPWLGPKVEEMLDQYAAEGIGKVLIVPIGFVCDHMEILYDIDVLFKNIAREKNIRLERTPSPNDTPRFIETLESVVLKSFSATGEGAVAP